MGKNVFLFFLLFGAVIPAQSGTSLQCNFDDGKICDSFFNGNSDDFDWKLDSGNIGPSKDVSGQGSYVYINALYSRTRKEKARLYSSWISGPHCLAFYYYMYARNLNKIGELNVYIATKSSETKIYSGSGDQGKKWKKSASLEIPDQNSQYQVVFEGVRGRRGVIALDEISLAAGNCGTATPSTTQPLPPTPKPPSGSCGQKGYGLSDNQRIVGGQQATPGEWPWQVALLSGSFQFCGGSLVSNQYVITAAHCVTADDWSGVTIRLGEHNIKVDEGKELDIAIARNGITPHPLYDEATTDYDIAIIKLSQPVQFSNAIKPICINKNFDFTGKHCYITGWGRIASGGLSPDILQEAQVPIVNRGDCEKSYDSGSITDRMFCAGYSKGGTDSCQGDSGGPLVCQHSDGSWHLTGITSWGKGCALAGYYGVYSHVANLGQWINQQTGL